jgi:mycofactocin precursor
MNETPDSAESLADEAPAVPLVEDVLVEEVSIDGMCGVY